MHRYATLVVIGFLAGCNCGEDMAEQDINVKAAGLYLTANPLDAPPGSLSEATNAVIRRRGIVEPRRGQEPDATVPSSAYADAMASFEGELIVHTSANAIGIRESTTTITAYSGTYTPPEGYPMRFEEAGGGLYATTDEGLQRLDSPSGAWTAAGVPPGLEGSATTSGTTGWLPYLSTVGYRLVWGTRDGDGALMLGAPSGRILLTNEVQNSTPLAFTWTRAGAVITATDVAHGLSTSDQVVIVSTTDTSAIPLGVYTITVTGADTFTFTGVNAGGASGSGTYVGDDSGLRDVAITTPIPDGIVLDRHFLQVYRTVLTTTGGADPGEDTSLVAERFPTSAELSAGFMSVVDIASFANGPSAYFNPSLGIGIAGAKEQPPLVTDPVVFNGYLFGVVQKYLQTLEMTLLAVGGANGLNTFQGITLTDGSTTETYYCNGVPADEGTSPGPGFRIFTRYVAGVTGAGTTAENIELTARSLVRVLNGYSALVTATYASGANDLPGQMVFMARSLAAAIIEARAYKGWTAWAPRMVQDFTGSPTRVGTTVTVDTGTNHHLEPGEVVNLITGAANFPSGNKTVVSTPTSTTFTYTEAGAAVAGASLDWETTTPEVEMVQPATPASYAFSDLEEPDAWPPRFRFQVGGPNVTLYRIIPQGHALIFFTSDGLYRLTGRTADEFVLLPMDVNARLVGQNTPVSIGNRAVALTDQGVISITDLGVQKISEPLDQLLLEYYAGNAVPLTEAAAFAYGYETENEYTLFLQSPEAGTGDPPDRAYTYNFQTSTWVGPWQFEWAGINSPGKEVRAAHVNAGDGRLYLAAGTRITRERKSRSLSDYQDALGVGIPLDVATVANTQKNAGAFKQWIEATIFLEKPQPNSCEVYFTTEIDSTEEGATLTTQGNANLRTFIPRNKSRSARLTVGLRHSTALEKPVVLGYSVLANTGSTRVGR